jgi:hypothetical protein
MAAAWLDVDRLTLERLAGLVDEAHRGVATAALLGEIRMLEDRFGLSPLARQRLRWQVGDVPVAAPPAALDAERWLRAVKDG